MHTNGNDYKEARLKALSDRYLEQYDIICFQELFDWYNTRKPRMVLQAKQKGLVYHAYSPQPSLFSTHGCDAGLLTVSRYPIISTDFCKYKYPPVGDDAIAMKGVLYTEIDLS